MRHLVSAAALALGIGISTLAPTSAQAFTLNSSLDCAAGSITGSSQCAGSYKLDGGENDVTNGGANNIATQLLNNDDIFNVGGGWMFGTKRNSDGTSNSNTNAFSVSGIGKTSGSFGLSNLDLSTNDIAVSLKSGKGFSMYYIKAGSITDPSQIQWNTNGTSVNRRGKAQALSHISYYVRLASSQTQRRRVPEPAMLSALLAVGAATALHRKKKRDM